LAVREAKTEELATIGRGGGAAAAVGEATGGSNVVLVAVVETGSVGQGGNWAGMAQAAAALLLCWGRKRRDWESLVALSTCE